MVSFCRSQWAHSELVYSYGIWIKNSVVFNKLSLKIMKRAKSPTSPNWKWFSDLNSAYSKYLKNHREICFLFPRSLPTQLGINSFSSSKITSVQLVIPMRTHEKFSAEISMRRSQNRHLVERDTRTHWEEQLSRNRILSS